VNLIITKNQVENTKKPLDAGLIIFYFKGNSVILLYIKNEKDEKAPKSQLKFFLRVIK
jgi:hypothetical protein